MAEKDRLEKLFRASAAETSPPAEMVETADEALSYPGDAFVLNDLPLWRVQWVALPGWNQQLHVHVPHYVDMLNNIGEGGLFGHLLLPGGSENLGKEQYRLVEGTDAALSGSLMAVRQLERMPDGRLLVLATALCRFRVRRATQTTPYSRADVEIDADDEEVREWASEARSVLEQWSRARADRGRTGGVPGDDATLRRLSRQAAAAGAGAAAQQWALRMVDLQGPEEDELAALDLACDVDAAAAAAAAAAREATEAVLAREGRRLDATAGWDAGAAAEAEGVEAEAALEAADDGAAAALLDLERSAWIELVACLQLSRALRQPGAASDAEVELPEPLLMLRPPPPDGGWPPATPLAPLPAAWLASMPPLRRAQRLSFLIPALLPQLHRQEALEARGTADRLQMEVDHLKECRQRLAALVALQKESGEGGAGGAQ